MLKEHISSARDETAVYIRKNEAQNALLMALGAGKAMSKRKDLKTIVSQVRKSRNSWSV